MIALIQRVTRAEVEVEGKTRARTGPGILLLLGIGHGDNQDDIEYLIRKTVHLRIFSDDEGNLNRSLLDTSGEILVVSQFTLLADTRKGRRPSFSDAAPPEVAEPLYRKVIEGFGAHGVRVAEGSFGAMMKVSLVNDGPVTIIIDSRET
jgi:D-tyrosyl-tRNA(Tyr) deacylase